VRRQEVSHLGFPGAETPKHQTLNMLHYFGVSSIGISGCATTGGLAPGFPGSRNSETPNSKHAPLFRDFLHRDFGTCETRGLALGFPDAETTEISNLAIFHRVFGLYKGHLPRVPKYRNFFSMYRDFGSLSGLASTREFALGYSGCRNTEISGFSYTLSFRDFACRDFGTCEYKGIRPWVFQIPKYRNIGTYLHAIISGFRKSGFRDLRVQGNSPLGIPGYRNSEIPTLKPAHLISGFLPSGFRKSGFRDLRVQGNSHLGTPGAETPKCPNPSTPLSFRDFASRGFGTCEYKGTRT
jgi:hypothetical protein